MAAEWIRERCLARGIPIRKLSPEEVAAGMAGVCGHVDWTFATRLQGDQDGTHTDPGPNFPWDVVMAKANRIEPEEEDMNDQQNSMLTQIFNQLPNLANGAATIGQVAPAVNEIRGNAQNILNGVVALLGRDPSGVSAEEIAAVIPDGIAADVADELHRRLGA